MTDTTRFEERLTALIGSPAPAPAGPTVDLFVLSPEDLERLGTLTDS
jgi:hypothetical protein